MISDFGSLNSVVFITLNE